MRATQPYQSEKSPCALPMLTNQRQQILRLPLGPVPLVLKLEMRPILIARSDCASQRNGSLGVLLAVLRGRKVRYTQLAGCLPGLVKKRPNGLPVWCPVLVRSPRAPPKAKRLSLERSAYSGEGPGHLHLEFKILKDPFITSLKALRRPVASRIRIRSIGQ